MQKGRLSAAFLNLQAICKQVFGGGEKAHLCEMQEGRHFNM